MELQISSKLDNQTTINNYSNFAVSTVLDYIGISITAMLSFDIHIEGKWTKLKFLAI